MSNETTTTTEISLYDVKTKQNVVLPLSQLKKILWSGKHGRDRYGVQGQHEGRKLVKFISKAQYDALDIPSEMVNKAL